MKSTLRKLLVMGVLGGGAAPISYLFRDLFSTDRASGAVNGTAAEPGPGNRVASGTMVLSGGYALPAAQYDTLAYPAMSRSLGTIMRARLRGDGTVFALSSNANGQSQVLGFNIQLGGNIRLGYGGFANLDAKQNGLKNTIYNEIVIAKPAGGWMFLQGGYFKYPTLVYYNRIQATATVYPGFYASEIGSTAPLTDFGIPQNVYIPTALAVDDFNRADGAPAGIWTDVTGSSAIATNVLVITPAGAVGIVVCETGKADIFVIARPTRTGGTVGIITHYIDADNYLRVIHDGTNLKVVQRLAGVESDLASAAVAYSAGKDIAVSSQGASVRAWYNDTHVASTAPTMDASLATATKAGLWSSDATNTLDMFEVYARGTDNEYASLGAAAISKGDLLVICDGDSLTAGNGETPYPTQLLALKPRDLINYAIGGQTVVNILATAPTKIDGIKPYWNKVIVVCWIGTNDINGGATTATVYANIVTYCNARRAAGYKVLVMTMMDRGLSGATETARLALNTSITTNWATFADAVLDVANDVNLVDSDNLTYFNADKTHLTTAGAGIVAGLVNTALLSM